jgi:hypothetical protein
VTFRKQVLRFSVLPAALFTLTMTAPASAQYYRHDAPPPANYGGRIHPGQIDSMVRGMGYQPVAEPRPRGPLWITHAVDRDGNHVRVLIDSYSGRVIDVLRRPVPPQNVSLTPPANVPFPPQGDPRFPQQSDPRFPQQYPPQARVPNNDYDDDDGPDYDYRDVPRNQPPVYPQSPQYNQPQYNQPPRTNVPQQGPAVIPYEPRSDYRLDPPVTNSVKKKETKEKKKDTSAALTPDKQKTPSPKTRPADAPKADTKKDTPKADTKTDAPKTAQTPKMPATDTQRAPETTGTIQNVPTFDPPKDQAPKATPPVQPPF